MKKEMVFFIVPIVEFTMAMFLLMVYPKKDFVIMDYA